MPPIGWGWSDCIRDEEARAAGFTNRDTWGIDNCTKTKGYLVGRAGVGISRDCGNWQFAAKCFNPGWIGDWVNEGCHAPGRRMWARKVDAFGIWSWEDAANWLISNDAPRVNNNWNGGIVREVYYNNRGTGGMWICVIVDDGACNPTFMGTGWTDEGCKSVDTRNLARQVDAKGYDWTVAANWLKDNQTTSIGGALWDGMVVINKWVENRGAAGMWVVVQARDNRCNTTTFSPLRTACDGVNQKTYQMCNNWAFNDPRNCISKAPQGTVAWQECDIGSSPGGQEPGHTLNICRPPRTTAQFPCVGAKNCFAILTDTYATRCDSTNFAVARKFCRGATQFTSRQCNNWAFGDPSSCLRRWNAGNP